MLPFHFFCSFIFCTKKGKKKTKLLIIAALQTPHNCSRFSHFLGFLPFPFPQPTKASLQRCCPPDTANIPCFQLCSTKSPAPCHWVYPTNYPPQTTREILGIKTAYVHFHSIPPKTTSRNREGLQGIARSWSAGCLQIPCVQKLQESKLILG